MSKGTQSERAQLVDICVNFHSAQLTSLTDHLLVRARAAHVTQILATGTSAASSRLALELARAHPGTVFATAGVHPHGAKSYDPSTFCELTELWECPEVVADAINAGAENDCILPSKAAPQKRFVGQQAGHDAVDMANPNEGATNPTQPSPGASGEPSPNDHSNHDCHRKTERDSIHRLSE